MILFFQESFFLRIRDFATVPGQHTTHTRVDAHTHQPGTAENMPALRAIDQCRSAKRLSLHTYEHRREKNCETARVGGRCYSRWASGILQQEPASSGGETQCDLLRDNCCSISCCRRRRSILTNINKLTLPPTPDRGGGVFDDEGNVHICTHGTLLPRIVVHCRKSLSLRFFFYCSEHAIMKFQTLSEVGNSLKKN